MVCVFLETRIWICGSYIVQCHAIKLTFSFSDILADHSRVKLIMQVFARLNAKEESVALAKLEAWWHFLQKLGTKLPSYFEQVCNFS